MTYKELQTEKYKSFESRNQRWREGQERFILKHFINEPKESLILDLGCGDGVGLRYFRDLRFQNVIGVEFCKEKAQKATTYGYPVLETDMHELQNHPSLAGIIDIVYSSHSLEHCWDPSTVLQHIHHVLKKDGTFFLILPYPDIGPEDAHCGKKILCSHLNDKGATLEKYLTIFGFRVMNKTFDSFREPEIWLELRKS
jgi:SAM-dependent methyltransferase